MKEIDLGKLLEFLEETADPRAAQLHYAIVRRIRVGRAEGTLEDLLGLKSPGPGKADGFLNYRLRMRNENLKKAVYALIKQEMVGEHDACGKLALHLKRFPSQYARIAAGKACFDTAITQFLYRACWYDPGTFALKQGALFRLLFP